MPVLVSARSGAVWSLEEAVAVTSNSQLGAELSGEEIDAITAFMKTLASEIPEITYPELPPNTAETPKPETMQRPGSAEPE